MKEIFWYCTTSCDTFCIEQPPSVVRRGVVCVSMCCFRFLATENLRERLTLFPSGRVPPWDFPKRIKAPPGKGGDLEVYSPFCPPKMKKWYDDMIRNEKRMVLSATGKGSFFCLNPFFKVHTVINVLRCHPTPSSILYHSLVNLKWCHTRRFGDRGAV